VLSNGVTFSKPSISTTSFKTNVCLVDGDHVTYTYQFIMVLQYQYLLHLLRPQLNIDLMYDIGASVTNH